MVSDKCLVTLASQVPKRRAQRTDESESSLIKGGDEVMDMGTRKEEISSHLLCLKKINVNERKKEEIIGTRDMDNNGNRTWPNLIKSTPIEN